MPKLYTINKFCEQYSVSRSTVYRLINDKKLTPVKIGRSVRISVVDAEKWLETLIDNDNVNHANDNGHDANDYNDETGKESDDQNKKKH